PKPPFKMQAINDPSGEMAKLRQPIGSTWIALPSTWIRLCSAIGNGLMHQENSSLPLATSNPTMCLPAANSVLPSALKQSWPGESVFLALTERIVLPVRTSQRRIRALLLSDCQKSFFSECQAASNEDSGEKAASMYTYSFLLVNESVCSRLRFAMSQRMAC